MVRSDDSCVFKLFGLSCSVAVFKAACTLCVVGSMLYLFKVGHPCWCQQVTSVCIKTVTHDAICIGYIFRLCEPSSGLS